MGRCLRPLRNSGFALVSVAAGPAGLAAKAADQPGRLMPRQTAAPGAFTVAKRCVFRVNPVVGVTRRHGEGAGLRRPGARAAWSSQPVNISAADRAIDSRAAANWAARIPKPSAPSTVSADFW
jgi:hypothetical protein